MQLELAAENAFIVYVGAGTQANTIAQVQAVNEAVRWALADVLIDTIASYASVVVIFDVLRCDCDTARARIEACVAALPSAHPRQGRLVELPVYYSAESGPDLTVIERYSGLTASKIIELHQAQEYRVYAIGFAPGFAYLGQVDQRIACPRLATPRQRVPRGAVAIADQQTAVYPAASPGGWNIIGLCPLPLFTPTASPMMPVDVGDRVRFSAISRRQFIAMGGELPAVRVP